jgi:hypothetical protein
MVVQSSLAQQYSVNMTYLSLLLSSHPVGKSVLRVATAIINKRRLVFCVINDWFAVALTGRTGPVFLRAVADRDVVTVTTGLCKSVRSAWFLSQGPSKKPCNFSYACAFVIEPRFVSRF